MPEVEVDVIGGSLREIFGTDSPARGDSVALGDGVKAEYESELTVKSLEGEAFRFLMDFSEFATYATLYKALEKSGAKILRIAGECVEVDREAIRDRLKEVLEEE